MLFHQSSKENKVKAANFKKNVPPLSLFGRTRVDGFTLDDGSHLNKFFIQLVPTPGASVIPVSLTGSCNLGDWGNGN